MGGGLSVVQVFQRVPLKVVRKFLVNVMMYLTRSRIFYFEGLRKTLRSHITIGVHYPY